MKIMYFCWEFPPVGSGIGVYIREMTQALMDAGHEVIVITSRNTLLKERESLGKRGTVYRLYDYEQIGSSGVAKQVIEIAAHHHVDWIEAADHLGEGAALLRMKNRPPVVVKCHYNDVIPNIRYGQARWWWQKPMIDLACFRDRRRLLRERVSMAAADGLICITRRMLQEIEAARLEKPAHVAVIPNPIGEFPGWVNDEASEPTMLFVGRIDFGKGSDFLPEILRSVMKFFPNARLEIAGEDGYARGVGSIRKWVERKFSDLMEHVTFLGHISPQILDEAYRRAWVILVPSRWDTFPMSVLEAMARGKAVVASPHGGMPEMLEGTGNSIADPESGTFADAVMELMGNDIRRREAGHSGRNKARDLYNPVRIVRDYVETVKGWL